MISSIIFSMGPVYARREWLGNTGIATFMAVSILAAVLTQYPVGRLSDRTDRRTVIAAVCTLATIVAGSARGVWRRDATCTVSAAHRMLSGVRAHGFTRFPCHM